MATVVASCTFDMNTRCPQIEDTEYIPFYYYIPCLVNGVSRRLCLQKAANHSYIQTNDLIVLLIVLQHIQPDSACVCSKSRLTRTSPACAPSSFVLLEPPVPLGRFLVVTSGEKGDRAVPVILVAVTGVEMEAEALGAAAVGIAVEVGAAAAVTVAVRAAGVAAVAAVAATTAMR